MQQNKVKGSLQRNDSTKELKSLWDIIDSAAERAAQAREDSRKDDTRRESSEVQLMG